MRFLRKPLFRLGPASLLCVALTGALCEPAKGPSLPPPGPHAADVKLETEPPGAAVVLDGVALGTAPVEVALNPGSHRVKASKSGYFPSERAIAVVAGRAQTVRLTLVPSH